MIFQLFRVTLRAKIVMQYEEVRKFLNTLSEKIKIFGIVFRDDRNKNTQCLLDLEIRAQQREDIIKELSAEDYVQGPIVDKINNYGEMWVFGKDVKGKEVYIKISLCTENYPAVCISFHIAEHKLIYQFK